MPTFGTPGFGEDLGRASTTAHSASCHTSEEVFTAESMFPCPKQGGVQTAGLPQQGFNRSVESGQSLLNWCNRHMAEKSLKRWLLSAGALGLCS